jgi:hypothetical protein
MDIASEFINRSANADQPAGGELGTRRRQEAMADKP